MRGTTVMLAVMAIWSVAEEAEAQVRRYLPSQPTVSPYLNLTRINEGALPNYYSLVRPQLQQQYINQREQAVQLQQNRQIQQLTNTVQQGLAPLSPTGVAAGFQYYGPTATFLNTSSFYPPPPRLRR